MPGIVISSRSTPNGIEPSRLVALDKIDRCAKPGPRHRAGAYDNPFAPDNVYGHALDLLKRHPAAAQGALHIDIGSGFGRIAEPLAAALGVTYVACDLDNDALGSLEKRGFETHRLGLDTDVLVYRALAGIIGGRQLASISMIDTLEHLDDPEATLRALSRISREYRAFVLISVPNTAHRDLGLRLMFGLWDYTETGILDHTHRSLFSNSVLRRMLARNGLHVVDANDVKLTASDQAYPNDHPALQSHTRLHKLLCELRELGDDFGSTNQLVRLCIAGPAAGLPAFDEREPLSRPLLSVVIRSDGRQADLLTEIMTCLAAQTITDFEILILGHALDRPRQVAIEQVIFELPDWLRIKIRFLRIDRGNKTDLLNDGFAAAAGRYISVLDEGDLVFAHWVEGFLSAAEKAPGQILHYVTAVQAIRRVEYNYATGIRANTGIDKPGQFEFEFFEHVRADYSPLPGTAFPRGLSHYLNFGFDPELRTFAGWDYFLRGAALVGVTSVPAMTAIHRQADQVYGKANIERSKVAARFNRLGAVLWPTIRLRERRRTLDELADWRKQAANAAQMTINAQRETEGLKTVIAAMSVDAEAMAADAAAKAADAVAKSIEIANMTGEFEEYKHLISEIFGIYSSVGWRLAAPLRLLARLFRQPPIRREAILLLSTAQLHALRQQLRNSNSCRMTRKLRRFGVRFSLSP